MEKDKAYSALLKEINTVQESKNLLHQLDALSDSLYNKKTTFEKKVDEYLSNSLKDHLLLLMEKNNISDTNTGQIEKFLKELKDIINSIPVLRLDIAYEPTTSHIKHIAEWMQYNMAEKVLLDLYVNYKLIGGAMIGFNGRIGDFTLKKKFEERYLDKKEKSVEKVEEK